MKLSHILFSLCASQWFSSDLLAECKLSLVDILSIGFEAIFLQTDPLGRLCKFILSYFMSFGDGSSLVEKIFL